MWNNYCFSNDLKKIVVESRSKKCNLKNPKYQSKKTENPNQFLVQYGIYYTII